jgi:hypothetical protein
MQTPFARLTGWALLLLLGGCVSLRPYRPELAACRFDNEDKPIHCDYTDKSDPTLLTDAIEVHPDYTLGIVEFTDQGWLFATNGRAQMLAVMNMLQKEADAGGDLTLIVFVHGWKHNAHSEDPNARDFRAFLSRVKSETPNRRIVGIYVGWRGLAVDAIEPIRSTTLLDRKQTAEHVAKGSVRELFARINRFQVNFTDESKRTLVSVLIGHSFGGLIVFNGVSQLLLDAAVDPEQSRPASGGRRDYRKVEPYFDLTILVNPAFEASRYEALHQVAACRRFPDGQTPVFLSLTAENDSATGFWFHAYRRIATLFEKYYQPKDVGNQERSGRKGKQTHKELEEDANRRTVGYVDRYRTHSLYLKGDVPPQIDGYQSKFECANVCSPLATASVVRPAPNAPVEFPARNGQTMVLIHEPRESCDPNNPFWVIQVNKKVISGHDGFFKFPDDQESYFTDFVVSLIDRKVEERQLSQRKTQPE